VIRRSQVYRIEETWSFAVEKQEIQNKGRIMININGDGKTGEEKSE
jgi:hypothetical protein